MLHFPNQVRAFVLLLLCLVSMGAVGDKTPDSAPPATTSLALQNCFACHGPQGNSSDGAIPSIAGLPRGYFIEVMRAYRHGGRFSTLMGRLVPAYTEAEVVEFADYFSRQTFVIHRQQVDWGLAQRGRKLHRLYCRECHGDRDRPADRNVPGLNGRWMDYLHWTLQDYLLGISQADEQMSEKLIQLVRSHGEAGIEALIHYYGSLPPAAPAPP